MSLFLPVEKNTLFTNPSWKYSMHANHGGELECSKANLDPDLTSDLMIASTRLLFLLDPSSATEKYLTKSNTDVRSGCDYPRMRLWIFEVVVTTILISKLFFKSLKAGINYGR